MAKRVSGLPEEFDIDAEIADFRFALMLKIRFGFEKRYDIYLRDLNKYLREHLSNPDHVHKIVNRITSSAYFTIPEEFWRGAEKAHRIQST